MIGRPVIPGTCLGYLAPVKLRRTTCSLARLTLVSENHASIEQSQGSRSQRKLVSRPEIGGSTSRGGVCKSESGGKDSEPGDGQRTGKGAFMPKVL